IVAALAVIDAEDRARAAASAAGAAGDDRIDAWVRSARLSNRNAGYTRGAWPAASPGGSEPSDVVASARPLVTCRAFAVGGFSLTRGSCVPEEQGVFRRNAGSEWPGGEPAPRGVEKRSPGVGRPNVLLGTGAPVSRGRPAVFQSPVDNLGMNARPWLTYARFRQHGTQTRGEDRAGDHQGDRRRNRRSDRSRALLHHGRRPGRRSRPPLAVAGG